MTSTPISSAAAGAVEQPKRSDNLALLFQEVLTVIARLRANRQRVTDANSFRDQIRNALKMAEQDGARRGYTLEDMRVAMFAVVAFLDESILNSKLPVFADWPRKPLQLELFGVQIAGEIFFRNIERLLAKPDADSVADLLELHQICLLLGFRGRYGSTGNAEIRTILAQIEDKIRRIRGPQTRPAQKREPETIAPARDKWIPVLRWVLAGCIALAILLFIGFKVSLTSASGGLRNTAATTSL